MLDKETLVKLLKEDGLYEEVAYASSRKDGFEHEGHKIRHVERYGGHEGAGEEHWVVFSVEKDDKIEYWEVPGWYQSHHGSEVEIDGMFRVQPVEVKVRHWHSL